MNFLAHLTVPGQSNLMLIGNFLADSFKGTVDKCPQPEVRKGIILHREIDHFADTHPLSKEIIALIRPGQGKFAGVALDILYDHLLAINFTKFHSRPLRQVVNDLYVVLESGKDTFTGHSKHFLPHMIQNDLLYNYQYKSVIKEVLFGMSQRTKYENNMQSAMEDWTPHLNLIMPLFDRYYREFLDHMTNFIADL